MSTHANASAANKGSNFKVIIGLVVALGLIGGIGYGFHAGVFKPAAAVEVPDGD